MAGNTKLKLLYILDILKRESDEEHPVSTSRFIEVLSQKGIACERKSIYTDISALREFGYDIIKTKTPCSGWFIGVRTFETPEICLLTDAVQSAPFISNEKTNVLIDKLKSLISVNDARSIQNRVYIDNRVKSTNSEIYYTIDRLHSAITKKRKVEFVYDKTSIDNNNIKTSKKTFKISPYAMIWNDDHYYLVGNNEKYDNLMHTRIDKIHSVKITDERIRNFCEVSEYKTTFDSADYANKVFGMFSGELKEVQLVCNNSLIDVMIDHFGKNMKVYKYSEDEFRIVFNAALSQGLVNWILKHASKVRVLHPAQLKTMVVNELNEISALYNL